MPTMGWKFFALALLLLTGCKTGGQLGEEGRVRFSQIVRYAESADFRGPVAIGSTVVVGLEHIDTGALLTDPPVNTGLTVRAEPRGHGGRATVLSLGFGQYAVRLEAEGEYELIADDDTGELDRLIVRTRPIGSLRVARNASVITTGRGSSGSTCTQITSVTGLENFVLHSNQTLHFATVPLTAGSEPEPLLGLLDLTATGPASVELDAPFLGRNVLANSIFVRARNVTGEPVTIRIASPSHEGTVTATIATSTEAQAVECN
jgi:hypothetical protein